MASIKYSILILLLIQFLLGCSEEVSVSPEKPSEIPVADIRLRLTLSGSDMANPRTNSKASRAIADAGYAHERRMNNVMALFYPATINGGIYIVDNDQMPTMIHTHSYGVTPFTFDESASSTSLSIVDTKGALTPSPYKIIIIANRWNNADFTANTTDDKLADANLYRYSSVLAQTETIIQSLGRITSAQTNSSPGLFMTGSTTINLSASNRDIGAILERNLVRIDIKTINDSSSDIEIIGVQIVNESTLSYLMPDHPSSPVDAVRQLHDASAVSLSDSIFKTANGFTLYTHETVSNAVNGGISFAIAAKYTTRASSLFPGMVSYRNFPLVVFNNGKDLTRNTIYRYILTITDTEIKVNSIILPWNGTIDNSHEFPQSSILHNDTINSK